MSMRKLAVAAIGLSMLVLGPAATLTAPELAQADPMTCSVGCDIVRNVEESQCRVQVPPVPSGDDMLEYGSCMIDATFNWVGCREACT